MARTKITARTATCGCGCGRLLPISRKNDILIWKRAEKITYRVISLRANEMAHYSSAYPIQLLRAFRGGGPLSGTYGVTFQAKGVDRITATYNARVRVKSYNLDDIEIEHLRLVKGSERREEDDDDKSQVSNITTVSSGKDVKLEVSPATGFSDEAKSNKVPPKGFYLLVEQIRSERPKLAYARARKAASHKWKSFSADVKMEYLNGVIPKQELTT